MATKTKALTVEIGSTGLRQSGGFIWDEFLAKLQGQNGAKVYREMADNDPIVGAVLFAIGMLVRSAEFKFQPADESSRSIEYRDRIQGALFDDMDHTWSEFMAEVMSMLTFGYALHEIVWKVCRGATRDRRTKSKFDDGLMMPRKLAPRAQETVWRWLYEDETAQELVGFEQFNYTGPNALVPLDRCLHFRTQALKDNPEGRSVLRPAYIPYLRKKTMEEAEGRVALRSAGIVVIDLPEEYFDPNEDEDILAMMATFRAMGKSLAQDRQGSAMLPSKRDEHGNRLFDIRYVTADNRQATEIGKIIDRLDKRIAMSVLADFILLGQDGTGSYALSTDKTDLFGQAVATFLTNITDTINRKLLPQISDFNSLDPKYMPKLVHGPVQVPTLDQLGNYIQKLSGAGAELFPNVELQDHLLRAAGAPVTSRVTTV